LKRRTEPTSVSPCLAIHSVILVGTIANKSISAPISFRDNNCQQAKIVETPAFIDCGAGGKFIDQNYARRNGITQIPLKELLPVFNVNSTPNKTGTITHKVELDLKIGDRVQQETLFVTGLGRQKIILGFDWLQENNPDINWQTGRIKWRNTTLKAKDEENLSKDSLAISHGQQQTNGQQCIQRTTMEEEPDDQEWMNQTVNPITDSEHIMEDFNSLAISFIDGKLTEKAEEIWIDVKFMTSQEFELKYKEKKPEQTVEEQIPPEYHEYQDVFNEKTADRFPKVRVWDH